MADFEDSGARYEEDRYERRDRSASPRGDRDEPARSRSPTGRDRPPPPPGDTRMKDGDDDGAINSGSNLFVTGIHPSLNESEVSRMFEKYGEVENCSIMLDPHTKESRGFGFVKMVTSDQADAAREGLQGETLQGRTLSIEKARRGKPRTPTPGKYFGPPKREGDHRGPPPRGGGYRDRYDDRRGGGYGSRRDDNYGGGRPRYNDYDERRGYGGGGGRRDRDEGYGGRGIDRYEGGRRDDAYPPAREGGGGGYGGGRDGYGGAPRGDRRGGGGAGAGASAGAGGYYDRDDRGYGAAPPRDDAPREAYGGGGRDYGREDRYAAR